MDIKEATEIVYNLASEYALNSKTCTPTLKECALAEEEALNLFYQEVILKLKYS